MIWWHRLRTHRLSRLELADVGITGVTSHVVVVCGCGRMWLR